MSCTDEISKESKETQYKGILTLNIQLANVLKKETLLNTIDVTN